MARLEADFDHLPHGRRYFGELAYTAKFKIRDPRSRSQGSCASCAREGSRGNFGQSAAPNSACEDCVKALRHGTQKALHLESELLLGSTTHHLQFHITATQTFRQLSLTSADLPSRAGQRQRRMGAGAGIGADWAWIPQAASQARGIRGVDPRQADKRRFGEIPQLRKEDKFACLFVLACGTGPDTSPSSGKAKSVCSRSPRALRALHGVTYDVQIQVRPES
ncbi:uncharacterized protein MKK02DRAFT_29489 [Dioszegia hungarica]|uniref:Uncharacterized protein n=1 Tax=Dioszegia hungarica TaxID=4972 RepID=A0AA38LYR8_9TREE|nr:uncharacterized protein MKK02DRAFT_29489 [Dioszegia hungarica]KAI9639421.1 hypothetical protein MKK02DRAFT_29489 [Dioszegia hungarica]